MPLSPKKVYKQPYIEGSCSYFAGNGSVQGPEEYGLTNDAAPGLQEYQCTERESENEEIAFWPKEENPAGPGSSNDNAQKQQAGDQDYDDPDHVHSDHNGDNRDPEEIAQAILEEKKEQYIKKGYEEGKGRAEKEIRATRAEAEVGLKEAQQILSDARRKAKDIVAASENKIVELSVAVAERLVCKQLELDPEAITGVVQETMNILDGGEQVELYVNPSDLEACLKYRGSLKEDFKEIIKLDIIADEKIPRGSCRVESEMGVAEYIIDEEKTQLEELLLNIARQDEAGLYEEEGSAYERH